MPVKKTKLLFKKEKYLGNIKTAYSAYCIFNDCELFLGEIRVFKNDEYCLPEQMFPRDSKSMLINVKSLDLAKRKCQKWFDDFIKYFSNN